MNISHQVRLSIFPAGTSTSTSTDGAWLPGSDQANSRSSGSNNNANTGNDPDDRRFSSSSSSEEPRFAGSNLRRARGSGTADGYVSDSSKQSTETDEAMLALRRAGGCDAPEGLQGAGLLFVRCGRY